MTATKLNVKSTFEKDLEQLNEQEQVSSSGEKHRQTWARPQVPLIDTKRNPIIFQQLEVDDYIDSLRSPTIRLYGLTEGGNSVLCHVTGFLPYFYIPAPAGFKENDVPSLIKAIENAIGSGNKLPITIEIHMKEIQIALTILRSIESGSVQFNGLREITFESNISYVLRFMIDCKVTGANWIELPPGTYKIRVLSAKVSTCQIEVETRYDQFVSHTPEAEWLKIAPLRILSFDIECAGRKGIFPEPKVDPVIQIANVVTIQ
ncbi:2616_t:CDS:2, partial [Paraglomus brasilianum]